MKKNHTAYLLFFFLFFSFLPLALFAQKSKQKEPDHKLIFNIKDCKEEKMLLVIQFKEKYILKDSAFNNGKGVYIFEGAGKYDGGMFSLVSGSKRKMLDFLMDETQSFTFHLDTIGNVNHFSVVGSPENALMLQFQQKNVEANKKMTDWSKKRKAFDESDEKDSAAYYVEKMKALNEEMQQFITDLIEGNPSLLFAKFQKSNRDIKIPDPPVRIDGSIDSTFQMAYYRTHYWDHFDLTDRRFLFLPHYDTKLNNYFKKVLWFHEVDTIIKYMDLMLDKTYLDSLMYRYLVEYLSSEFQTSKGIGHDAIFVHLVNHNILAGKCTWMDEDLIKKYKMRVEDIEPLLIGKKSVEIVAPDTTQTDDVSKWISSYKMPKKYRILWFYDHTCSHCLKEAKEMKVVYDSLENIGQLNFDVYAVNHTTDFKKWKKYILDNGFSWINVGGEKGSVDWKEAYHIQTNPQFYMINQDKIIILNKDISKDMIPVFLKEYEKIEADKARLKNKKQ
jgi:hypothetical protein